MAAETAKKEGTTMKGFTVTTTDNRNKITFVQTLTNRKLAFIVFDRELLWMERNAFTETVKLVDDMTAKVIRRAYRR